MPTPPFRSMRKRVDGDGGDSKPRDFSRMEKKSSAPRILVVDDEPLMRWSLAQTLLDCGYEVSEAGDGQTALQRLEDARVPIDVVLLGYPLPDSNDLELLSTIRRMSPWSQVILMTAFGTPEVVSDAQQLGAYCVLGKPFELNDLAALVQQVGCMPASVLSRAGAQPPDACTLVRGVADEPQATAG